MKISHDQILEMLNTGISCYQQGNLIRAEQLYRQVLAAHPKNADALHLLGLILRDRGDIDGALQLFKKALKIAPVFFGARYNLADTYLGIFRLPEAIENFQRVVKLKPDYADGFNGLGIALMRHHQLQQSLTAFSSAVQVNPDYAEAHTNLGAVLRMLGRPEEAEASHLRALALQPAYVIALVNLANLYVDQGRLAEAKKCCEQAIAIAPQHTHAYRTLGNLLLADGDLDKAMSAFEKMVALNSLDFVLHSSLLFALNYSATHSATDIFAAHKNWGDLMMSTINAPPSLYVNQPVVTRKLRLGYVSPDFRRHAVAYLIEPVLAAHNHEAFHIVCYANVTKEDEVTVRLRSTVSEWRDIAGMNDEAVIDMIRHDKIDILIDLAGHTAGNRLGVFARRPAPIQIAWLGYYNTTGLPAMNYILTDVHANPVGDEQAFVEEMVRLPHTRFCYRPPEYAPSNEPVIAPGEPIVTFGSFNKLVKINQDVVALWSQILQRVPNSRMVLKAKQFVDLNERKRWELLFFEQGIAPDRLDLRGYSPHVEMLAEYIEIDIALDPFPFTGGLTTFEALWMGVPVITLSGETMVGRQTASMLTVMGHNELIATSREQYVQLAVSLAGETDQLATFRKTLRADMAGSPLCDAVGFTGDLEYAYRTLWQHWCGTN